MTFRQCGVDGIQVFKSGAKTLKGVRYLSKLANDEDTRPETRRKSQELMDASDVELDRPAVLDALDPIPRSGGTPDEPRFVDTEPADGQNGYRFEINGEEIVVSSRNRMSRKDARDRARNEYRRRQESQG